MTDTFGGVVALRRKPGLKWHRTVDFATAEAYARRHGRTRLRGGRLPSNVMVACGQDLTAGGHTYALEQKLFEDRPPAAEACGKCWS